MKKVLIVMVLVLVLAAIACGRSGDPIMMINSEGTEQDSVIRHQYGLDESGVQKATDAVRSFFSSDSDSSSRGPIYTVAPTTTKVPGTYSTVSPADVGSTEDVQRMIVKTGKMSLVVEDIVTTMDRIIELTASYQGYVVSSNSWHEGERLRGTITIRIPSGDYEDITGRLIELAVDVTSQNTSSQDVTEEYVDLSSKLKNLEATEQQLLEIMKKAEKVEDVLKVQSELTNTRADIEQTKGRMQYLEQTSATSLIQIDLEQSKLDVEFTAYNGRVVEVGEVVYFAANVAGGFAPYSYQWDFGDGNTSMEIQPGHIYKSRGTYSVSLVITDNKANTKTATVTNYVTVVPAPGWSAGNTASKAWKGLVSFGHGLSNVLIWLGIFSPLWIIIGLIIWWSLRRRRNRKQHSEKMLNKDS
jgi:PKD repeat protein